MLDADYFKTTFIKQIDDLGGVSAAAFLILRSGREYAIQTILSAEPEFLIARIYPPNTDPGSPEARDARRKIPGGEIFHDHVAIPYSEISHVRLTIATADEKNTLGFHATK